MGPLLQTWVGVSFLLILTGGLIAFFDVNRWRSVGYVVAGFGLGCLVGACLFLAAIAHIP